MRKSPIFVAAFSVLLFFLAFSASLGTANAQRAGGTCSNVGKNCTSGLPCVADPKSTTGAGICQAASDSVCTTDSNCDALAQKQGWRDARCVSAGTSNARCIEAPGSGSDLPEGPQSASQVLDLLDLVVDWIFAIAMTIALIYLVLATFQFVTGGGDPQQVNQARQKLMYAFIGIAVALVSAGFINVIRSIVER